MGYCEWAYTDPLNTTYHDNEWGVPVHDDRQMFEHLTLENLQCGLSWLIVLRKRDIFRQCFDNFDYDKVLLTATRCGTHPKYRGMIRSPRKIQAVINNACCCQKLRDEFGTFVTTFGASPAARPSSTRAQCQRTDSGQQRPVGNGLAKI